MKSVYYITFIMRHRFVAVMMAASVGLSGCAGVPIAKTNCWASAGSTVTASTMGTSAPSGNVSRAATPVLDVIPCK